MVTAAAPVLAGTRPMAEAGRRSGSRRGEDPAAGALDGGQGGGLVERRNDLQRPTRLGGLDNALLPGFGPGGRARCQAALPWPPVIQAASCHAADGQR